MKKMICLVAVLAATLLLGACTTYLTTTMTYEVDTGDSISVTVDAKAGYSQDGQVPFTVSKDGEAVLVGAFMTQENFQAYETALTEAPPEGVQLLEQGEKDGNTYLFFQYDGDSGTGYNYVVEVNGSSTGVMLGSEASQEEAESCFAAITFSVE